MDTIDKILVGAGVINKLQVDIPPKITSVYKIQGEFSVQIEPLYTGKDTN